MSEGWDPAAPGVLTLPSGRRVRGRGRGAPLPPGPLPEFGVYLLGRRPEPVPWDERWVRWPDFRTPADPADLRAALLQVWERAVDERVELACHGGTGRTGTALACLAVLDGVPATEAVAFVRANYRPRAVETPGQRRLVAGFQPR
jgi:protein-tyrosine phosphatase